MKQNTLILTTGWAISLVTLRMLNISKTMIPREMSFTIFHHQTMYSCVLKSQRRSWPNDEKMMGQRSGSFLVIDKYHLRTIIWVSKQVVYLTVGCIKFSKSIWICDIKLHITYLLPKIKPLIAVYVINQLRDMHYIR